MMLVLFRQDDFVGRNAPVDVEVWVVPCQCSFALRGIKVVAFILENNFRREHAEAVGKTAGDKELAMVFFCQLYGYVLAERGRAFADIHGHIQYGTFDDAYQLALCVWRFLKMKTAQYAVTALTFIVLYEMYGAD